MAQHSAHVERRYINEDYHKENQLADAFLPLLLSDSAAAVLPQKGHMDARSS